MKYLTSPSIYMIKYYNIVAGGIGIIVDLNNGTGRGTVVMY